MEWDLNERCDKTLPTYLCTIGNIAGWTSSFIWFTVLFPQLIKNFKLKSVNGISLIWAIFNFSASYVNLFFVFQNSLPLFAKITAVYMPTLEFLLLVQFYHYDKYDKGIKTTFFCLFLFVLIVLSVVNIFLSQYYIDYLEWIAIILWSIETFPQIYLNFKNKSTKGLSKVSQLICFIGKTSDILQSYLLNNPQQKIYLAFFSSSTAYVGNIQVLIYYNMSEEKLYEEEDSEFLKGVEFNSNKNKHKILRIFLVILVCLFLFLSSFGFIVRTENSIFSIIAVLCFYLLILFMSIKS